MKGLGRARFFFGLSSFISSLLAAYGIIFAVFAMMFGASFLGGIGQLLYDVVYTYPWYIVAPCSLLIAMLIVAFFSAIIMAFKKYKIKSVTQLLFQNTAVISSNVVAILTLLAMLEYFNNMGVNIPLFVVMGVGVILSFVNVILCSDLGHKATPRSAKRRCITAYIFAFIYLGGYIALTYFKYVNLITLEFLQSNPAIFILLATLLLLFVLHLFAIFIYPSRSILEVAGIQETTTSEEDEDEEDDEEVPPLNAPQIYIIKAHEYENRFKITKIDVPANYSKIEEYAFAGCRNMKEAIIPSSIQEIGDMAFAGCSSLKEMTYLGTCEQFKAMKRGQGWIDSSLIIHCLNGGLKVEMKQGGKTK